MTACAGIVLGSESIARERFAVVSQEYRPEGKRPTLPTLRFDSTLQELLTFAILNDPAIEASYYDWQASIERITTARSLPHPKLTIESDIADMVMSLMPGLMFDFPGPGKLSVMGAMASSESQGKYYALKSAILRSAAAVKNAYYRLQALEDSIAVNNRSLELLRDLEDVAHAQHSTGKVTLQDVLRAQIERDKLFTIVHNLRDSRAALQATLKGALGLAPQSEVPMPIVFTNSAGDTVDENILAQALERNPQLKQMQAEIDKAEAAFRLAQLGIIPDVGIGVEVDVKPNPVIINPEFTITLPLWRDKIAAEIAAAQAEARAARSRLSREEINLAVDFALMLYMYRESNRNLQLLSDKLIPKATRSVEIARSGYIGGRSSFIDFLDAERTLLEFELSRIEARAMHETALTNLSLTLAGTVPKGASFIDDELEKVRK